MDIIPGLRYRRNCTGSSREQAATSLKYRGLSLLVAGSFSETYKRNALNNGLLTIEAPKLVLVGGLEKPGKEKPGEAMKQE